MDYIHHPSFDDPAQHQGILRNTVEEEDQEIHLFKQMNLLKHRATHAQTTLKEFTN